MAVRTICVGIVVAHSAVRYSAGIGNTFAARRQWSAAVGHLVRRLACQKASNRVETRVTLSTELQQTCQHAGRRALCGGTLNERQKVGGVYSRRSLDAKVVRKRAVGPSTHLSFEKSTVCTFALGSGTHLSPNAEEDTWLFRLVSLGSYSGCCPML